MKLLVKFFICSIFIFILSCQTGTNQNEEKISVEYYFRFLEPEQQMRAEATFFKGDSTKRRNIRVEKVYFQEKAMEARQLKMHGTRYRSEINGSYPQSLSFRFINKKGKTHTHQTAMAPILSFDVKESSENNEMILSWEGTPLSQEESIVLLFSDKNEVVISHTHEGATPKSSLTFSKEKLKDLANGNGKLYLVKKRLSKDIQKNTLVQTLVEYYTDAITFKIKN